MPFINNVFTQQNIPNIISQKIRLETKDIMLNYVMTNNRDSLTFTYLVSIIKQNPVNPMLPMQYNQVDLNSLKIAILGKFKTQDLKYIEIKNFDTSKVIVRFKHEDWIKDAFNNVAGQTTFSKFEMIFRLKKQIPMYIVFDGFMSMFNTFMVPKMIEYVKQNKLGKNHFLNISSSFIKDKLNKYFNNMMDYSYNFQQNVFSIKLKSPYILLITYGIGKLIDNKAFMNVSEKNFEETTKKFLKLNSFK